MERNTHQKENVLKVLRSLRGEHPTVETVYDHVSQIIPSISRATVYRILNQYTKQNAAKQINIPASADRYDDLMEPHYHLLCDRCKSLVDLSGPKFDDIPLPQNDESGCEIKGVQVIFTGICSKCAANNKVTNR